MKVMICKDVLREFARITNQYLVVIQGMELGVNCKYPDYKIEGAPYIDYGNPDHKEAIHYGEGVIVCQTEEEAYGYFDQTILDEIENGIYAIVINNNGVIETENT